MSSRIQSANPAFTPSRTHSAPHPLIHQPIFTSPSLHTPPSSHSTPHVKRYKSFTEDLLDEDSCEVGSEWNSFATHFTQEFEWLKGEVDALKSEVKNLKRTIKELKANSTPGQDAQEQQTQENQLLLMVKNTTLPLDGLKVLLFHLYTSDEVRLSSLKGRTTVTGGESVGLQRQKLDLIYCKFWIFSSGF